MNVLVIDPGHGSYWLEDAEFIDWNGRPDPNGDRVTGTWWDHQGGSLLPDGGIWMPETLTYPRSLVLRIKE